MDIPQKKLFILASYPKSLIDFRLDLLRAFLAAGYLVVASAPADEAVAKKLAEEGITFVSTPLKRTGLNPFFDFYCLYQLYALLKREKPTLFFGYTIKPVIYGTLSARAAKVPRIYSMITGMGYVFSMTTLKSRLIGRFAQILFRFALNKNDGVFFQNRDNQKAFFDRCLLRDPTKSFLVNGSGVNVASFVPAPYPAQLTFLMIGRLLIDKGIREYFEAARFVKALYPEVRFLLAGWIDDNPNAINPAELDEHLALKNVQFVGIVDDVRPLIATASVYVLPSYCEGMPRTVLEAMSMARPIITTQAPGCRETVIPERNGFLCAVKSVDDLVHAMKKFIEDPHLVPMMGSHSRQIAVERFDVHKINALMLSKMLTPPSDK